MNYSINFILLLVIYYLKNRVSTYKVDYKFAARNFLITDSSMFLLRA